MKKNVSWACIVLMVGLTPLVMYIVGGQPAFVELHVPLSLLALGLGAVMAWRKRFLIALTSIGGPILSMVVVRGDVHLLADAIRGDPDCFVKVGQIAIEAADRHCGPPTPHAGAEVSCQVEPMPASECPGARLALVGTYEGRRHVMFTLRPGPRFHVEYVPGGRASGYCHAVSTDVYLCGFGG